MLLKQNLSISLSIELIKQLDLLKDKLWISRSETVEKLMKESLESKLISDAKALAKMKFDDVPNEDEWVLIQAN